MRASPSVGGAPPGSERARCGRREESRTAEAEIAGGEAAVAWRCSDSCSGGDWREMESLGRRRVSLQCVCVWKKEAWRENLWFGMLAVMKLN